MTLSANHGEHETSCGVATRTATLNDLILHRGWNSRKPDRCGPAF